MKSGESNKLVWVLVILLLGAVGYIGYDKYSAYAENQRVIDINEGIEAGASQAIITIAQQAAQCNQVPLIVGEQTINVIAVECLQALAQAQAQGQ